MAISNLRYIALKIEPDAEHKHWHGDCIICRYYNKLWQDSLKVEGKARDDIQGLARRLKPIERYYYNVKVIESYDSKQGKLEVPLKRSDFELLVCNCIVKSNLISLGTQTLDLRDLGILLIWESGRNFKDYQKDGQGKRKAVSELRSVCFPRTVPLRRLRAVPRNAARSYHD